MSQHLPIDEYIPQIINQWQNSQCCIINASAGSGKTTRLPWALTQKTKGRIIVLEPRKLAAKMAAMRVAEENHLKLGEEIGFAFRDEVTFGAESQLIFFTEGTFLRFLEDQKFFESIDTIIFDEFHERHLDTDLVLAIIRQKMIQYPNLKLVLMSATIDESIAKSLDAKVIQIQARMFEVLVHHLPNQPSILNQDLALKVRRVMEGLPSEGDVLVFLPGMKEILRTKDILQENFGRIFILHSEVEKSEQEKIMLPSRERKIILSTNIAESSLTIPGIKYVIDSGLVRNSEFNPWSGIKFFQDRPITQSSAIQRMYRAGRTQDGECFRLYAEFDFKERPGFKVPDVLTKDLTDAYLVSASYQHQLLWITDPPSDKWSRARVLNELLGTTHNECLTEIGEFAIGNNLSLRVARILWEARNLAREEKHQIISYVANHLINEDPKYLLRRLSSFLNQRTVAENKEFELARYLLPGLVDQIGKLRGELQDFIHYSGQTLKSKIPSSNLGPGLYLLTQINQRQQVEQVMEIEEDWFLELNPFPLREVSETHWSEKGIQIQSKTVLGSIIIDEVKSLKKWNELTSQIQSEFIHKNNHRFQEFLQKFKTTSLYQRATFYARYQKKELNFTYDFQTLLENTQGEQTYISSFFAQELQEQLGVNLDQVVPETIRLHQKTYSINYEFEPSIEGHIQEFYGLASTPQIMSNTPLTLILLGPHKRPIQYTKDLTGFWKRTYPQFLKEWQREYPRHHWPQDPLNAPAVLLKRQL